MAWRKCSVCAKEIPWGGVYQVCGVSTCRKSAYCSVDCWEVHLPVMNHKSAYAEERRAPRQESEEGRPQRRLVPASKERGPSSREQALELQRDVLIVASKLKSYVKARSGMNTSASVLEALSQIVRERADEAMERARAEGRKTLMDRDFK